MKIKLSGEFHLLPKVVTNQLELLGEPAGKKRGCRIYLAFLDCC